MLGRLPLAIELAAARTAVMPLAEVADSMLREIDRSEEAGEPPLAAALRSSLALLTSEQRDTLRSLAGFAAPFTRGAAAAVCGERPRDRDLDQLRVVLARLGGGGRGGAGLPCVAAHPAGRRGR